MSPRLMPRSETRENRPGNRRSDVSTGERNPALAAGAVCEIVEEGTPVYVIADGPLTRELERLLPPRFAVFGGAARIRRPPVEDHTDPFEHPLVFDRDGVYGDAALARLWEGIAAGWRPAHEPPGVGPSPRVAPTRRGSPGGDTTQSQMGMYTSRRASERAPNLGACAAASKAPRPRDDAVGHEDRHTTDENPDHE